MTMMRESWWDARSRARLVARCRGTAHAQFEDRRYSLEMDK
jgi:hypothetical protein